MSRLVLSIFPGIGMLDQAGRAAMRCLGDYYRREVAEDGIEPTLTREELNRLGRQLYESVVRVAPATKPKKGAI